MKPIQERFEAMGIPTDTHESDLYVKDTAEARIILDDYEFKNQISLFTDAIDGAPWIEIPFQARV